MNLNSKFKYVLHHRNLKQYLDLGLKLTNVHRVLQFEEEPWLAPFIELNTDMRKEATLKSDKAAQDQFKLMSNAVFGKTMENLEKRVNIEVITSSKIAKKRIAKPNFKRAKIFRHDLVGVDMIKTKIILNRPLQVGFAILDISKTLMYNFHYNICMKRFPSSKLLFTDTDSLAYVVDGDVYDGMTTFQNEFDFSEYQKDHPLYDPKNMMVLFFIFFNFFVPNETRGGSRRSFRRRTMAFLTSEKQA